MKPDCFKCKVLLVQRSVEQGPPTAGKHAHKWGEKHPAQGAPIQHSVWVCPNCHKVRAVGATDPSS